jgi:hypothetical protein
MDIRGHTLMCGGLDGLNLATFFVLEVLDFPELILTGNKHGHFRDAAAG